jgi:ZIP family zinc transporter
MPYEMVGGWQFKDGNEWKGDASISIKPVNLTDADGVKPIVDASGGASEKDGKDVSLQRMGINTAVAIAIHNFPEGLATFVATLADPAVGITLAVAIAIHNIPEGLCVALPIFYATGSRHRGFAWALLSGLSEPVGALIGYGIIKGSGDDMNQLVYGILFGVVGGMMVGITITELLPTAQRYDPADKIVSWSVMIGMLVMAMSLVLFQY